MSDTTRRENEPFDRLTRLSAEMTSILDAKGDEVADVKCMVFLHDDDTGGIQLHGYDDDTDAMVDLLIHLQAIFRANGKDLMVIPLSEN